MYVMKIMKDCVKSSATGMMIVWHDMVDDMVEFV